MDARKTGQLIAKLRREQEMNQSELAQQLGVTNKAISRWETGRGYPDIETLPELSKILNVSIPELLHGELAEQTVNDIQAAAPVFTPQAPVKLSTKEMIAPLEPDNALETVCIYAGQQSRRQRKKITFLTALLLTILAVVLLIGIAVRLIPYVYSFYHSVVGSPECVIATDYSSLTYLGRRYIPLPMHGYECQTGECMVSECQVENLPFAVKLLYGDMLYEVKNVPCNEIVYLQTEYDGGISKYYVLETEYESYYRMLVNGDFAGFYSVRTNENGYETETQMDPALVQRFQKIAETEGAADVEHSVNLGSVDILAYEENRIFYRWEGTLYRRTSGYYWSPCHYYEGYGGYYMTDDFYQVHGMEDLLQHLFSYYD